jgi:hypothetical protein
MMTMMILTSSRANYCVTHFHQAHAVIILDKCLHNCRFFPLRAKQHASLICRYDVPYTDTKLCRKQKGDSYKHRSEHNAA